MNITPGLRLSLISTILFVAISCQQESKTNESIPAEKASVPCDYIHDAAGYVDCIYRMNPDTQSLWLEPLEAGIPDLTRFTMLTTLRISSNGSYHMKVLNQEVLKVEGLKHLILSKLSLTSLPENIVNLENLETLTVAGGGRLQKLPDNISKLKKLRVLNLWRNRLNGDSLDFTGMDALELVVIGENEAVDVPKLKRRWPKLEILDYYTGEY